MRELIGYRPWDVYRKSGHIAVRIDNLITDTISDLSELLIRCPNINAYACVMLCEMLLLLSTNVKKKKRLDSRWVP